MRFCVGLKIMVFDKTRLEGAYTKSEFLDILEGL